MIISSVCARPTKSTSGDVTGNGASAARSELLATEYARQTVRTAVAAETARAYFGLLAADAELAMLRDTLQSRDETVALQTDLYQAGLIGDYDLQRAQAERAAVAANVAVAERAVGTYETALAAIVGRSPRAVFAAEDRPRRDAGAPAWRARRCRRGLPSDLLERRPDVQTGRSPARCREPAHRCGARAVFSVAVADRGLRFRVGSACQPVFHAGARLGNRRLAVAAPDRPESDRGQRRGRDRPPRSRSGQLRADRAERFSRNARRADRQPHTRDALAAQTERAQKLKPRSNSPTCATAGYSGYIDVLDAQRQLLQAQTLQILAARDVRFALIDLAKAMGGGWDYLMPH
jgi:multidrug efflux system outer membrane protein